MPERKPDLALNLGSSYRYENREGANVYGCFGFAMPKKKRYTEIQGDTQSYKLQTR